MFAAGTGWSFWHCVFDVVADGVPKLDCLSQSVLKLLGVLQGGGVHCGKVIRGSKKVPAFSGLPQAAWAGGVEDGSGIYVRLCCKVRDLEFQDF